MGKYFCLQLKRAFRTLPLFLLAGALLFGSIRLILDTTVQATDAETETKFQIGMVGTAGDTYLEIGLAALQMMDTTRFSIELRQMTEQEAIRLLEQGSIAAYILIPEDFMQQAMVGEFLPVRFVSTAGASGLVSFVKEELTSVLSLIITEAHKGIYGVGDALIGSGNSAIAEEQIGAISIDYVKYILERGKIYRAESLGISDGLDFGTYLMCGLTVVFISLLPLSLAPLMTKKDLSLEGILSSKGIGAGKQVLSEYVSSLLVFTIPLIFGFLFLSADGMLGHWDPGVTLSLFSMSFFLFHLSRDLVSGMLLYFFTTILLSFLSGCLYPIAFFPEGVQRIAACLPTGLARMQLAAHHTSAATDHTAALLLWSGLFLLGSILLRHRRLKGGCL